MTNLTRYNLTVHHQIVQSTFSLLQQERLSYPKTVFCINLLINLNKTSNFHLCQHEDFQIACDKYGILLYKYVLSYRFLLLEAFVLYRLLHDCSFFVLNLHLVSMCVNVHFQQSDDDFPLLTRLILTLNHLVVHKRYQFSFPYQLFGRMSLVYSFLATFLLLALLFTLRLLTQYILYKVISIIFCSLISSNVYSI